MGQVIMPEILSDHDLDWGGDGGTPISGGTYYAAMDGATYQTIIAEAGTYNVGGNGIWIGGISYENLIPANVKSGEHVIIDSGAQNPLVDFIGTGLASGYKLLIFDNVPLAGSSPTYSTIPITMSGGAVYGNCYYIQIPASSLSGINPNVALAIPDLDSGAFESASCENEGGGFLSTISGDGSINDATAYSGGYSISANSNVVWCSRAAGIKMPVNTHNSSYKDDDDNTIYTPGPTLYTVFVLGTPAS